MSLQWTLIAGYLYFEIGVVILMMMPIFSPRRWNQFFKSRLFAMFQQHAAVYFYVLLGVLTLFLLDAVREMRKYSHGTEGSHVHLASEMKGNVKLFRAQRNFYITGFAIFLAFVIRRIVNFLIIQDELTQKAEKIIKEAENAVKLAKTTVLANTMEVKEKKSLEQVQSILDVTEDMLKLAEGRVKELETEVSEWKMKYEEIQTKMRGKGDE